MARVTPNPAIQAPWGSTKSNYKNRERAPLGIQEQLGAHNNTCKHAEDYEREGKKKRYHEKGVATAQKGERPRRQPSESPLEDVHGEPSVNNWQPLLVELESPELATHTLPSELTA